MISISISKFHITIKIVRYHMYHRTLRDGEFLIQTKILDNLTHCIHTLFAQEYGERSSTNNNRTTDSGSTSHRTDML